MARTKKTAIFTRARPLFFCSKAEPGGMSGFWLFIFKWRCCVCLLRCWLILVRFAAGFCLKKPRSKIHMSVRFVSLHCSAVADLLFYHLCWGCHGAHPYLLISRPGKGLHRDVDGLETDPSSNKLEKAKLRRRKSHFSPLLPLLLAMNLATAQGVKEPMHHEFSALASSHKKRAFERIR